jgi:hypothetical protein
MSDDNKIIEKRILDAAVEIRQDVALEVVYQHGIFCQVALPRSKPEGRVFERSFKNASLLVEAGKLWDGRKWVEWPIPYGPKPRLALIHINSEAVRAGSPSIEIGRSVADFLRKLGLPDQDGRTYNLFKRQMMALAAARLTMGFTVHNQAITIDAKPIKEFRAWLANDEKQQPLWPGYLQLTQEYFQSLQDHAVPLDPRALSALSHSALALDIYSWLGRRLYTLPKPVKVAFPLLKEQFGQEYTGKKADDHFKEKFLKMMKQVLAVYPEANVVQVTGGLILNPSKPPVRKTLTQGHSRRKQEPLPLLLPSQPNLKPLTVERFRELYAGLDPYACQGDFDAWLSGKGKPPANYNRAFLGFAKKWAKGKR